MPEPPRCPFCGEDRQIELVKTGARQVYVCGVCAKEFGGVAGPRLGSSAPPRCVASPAPR